MVSKENRFIKDLKEVQKVFPDLLHTPTRKNPFILSGNISIFDANDFFRGIFMVRIEYANTYPLGFAKLYEVGEAIPRMEDWHKGMNDQCCVCTIPEEVINQHDSQPAIYFIIEYAVPFLVNHIHKEEYGFYPNGEYPHREAGTIEWYQEFFPNCSFLKIVEYLKQILNNKELTQRNKLCICGSGLKYKRCHQIKCRNLKKIPKKLMKEHIQILEYKINAPPLAQ